MRATFVHALPFHRWILQGLRAAMEEHGWEIEDIDHVPSGPNDWLHKHLVPGDRVHDKLAASHPDVVIAADYPYLQLAAISGAPVLATRHSLASRGNTWAWEQADADLLLTWSEWDEQQLADAGVTTPTLRSGCVWVAGLHARCAGVDSRPVVAWCPTWNETWNCRDEVERQMIELADRGWRVVVRPHPATQWREPKWIEHLSDLGFWLWSSTDSPRMLLCQADVLVTDVSGVGLWALAVGDAELPVVWVDPSQAALDRSVQYSPSGPEWTFRDQVGERVKRGEQLATAVLRAQEDDHFHGTRRCVRDMMIGTPEWTRGACARATALITERIGTGGRTTTTT